MQAAQDAGYTARVFSEAEWAALTARAVELGREHGTSAGSWVEVDGEASARAWLAGIDDGDPAVLDQLPRDGMSGEWADGYGMADLYRDLDVSTWDDTADGELCSAYEGAFRQAVEAEVARAARAQLDVPA